MTRRLAALATALVAVAAALTTPQVTASAAACPGTAVIGANQVWWLAPGPCQAGRLR